MNTLMTLREVATYLRLSKDTVYRMAQSAKIPASKLGTQWRFRKSEVDAWIDKNKNVARAGSAYLQQGISGETPRKKKSRSAGF
jgi:excisionase family DNA binding protein